MLWACISVMPWFIPITGIAHPKGLWSRGTVVHTFMDMNVRGLVFLWSHRSYHHLHETSESSYSRSNIFVPSWKWHWVLPWYRGSYYHWYERPRTLYSRGTVVHAILNMTPKGLYSRGTMIHAFLKHERPSLECVAVGGVGEVWTAILVAAWFLELIIALVIISKSWVRVLCRAGKLFRCSGVPDGVFRPFRHRQTLGKDCHAE